MRNLLTYILWPLLVGSLASALAWNLCYVQDAVDATQGIIRLEHLAPSEEKP